MSEDKCYILVRADLSPGQQIVQSAHAAAELERKYPGSAAGRTMVVLSVPDRTTLLAFAVLSLAVTKAHLFFEPDINESTALAVAPSPHYGFFKTLPLAGRKRKRFWRFL